MKIMINGNKIIDSSKENIVMILNEHDRNWLINFLKDRKIEHGREVMFTIDKNIGKIPSNLL